MLTSLDEIINDRSKETPKVLEKKLKIMQDVQMCKRDKVLQLSKLCHKYKKTLLVPTQKGVMMFTNQDKIVYINYCETSYLPERDLENKTIVYNLGNAAVGSVCFNSIKRVEKSPALNVRMKKIELIMDYVKDDFEIDLRDFSNAKFDMNFDPENMDRFNDEVIYTDQVDVWYQTIMRERIPFIIKGLIANIIICVLLIVEFSMNLNQEGVGLMNSYEELIVVVLLGVPFIVYVCLMSCFTLRSGSYLKDFDLSGVGAVFGMMWICIVGIVLSFYYIITFIPTTIYYAIKAKKEKSREIVFMQETTS